MFNSIRTRLTMWFTAVFAVVLIIFTVAAYLVLNYTLQRQTDDTLREISRTFISGIEHEQADAEKEKDAADGVTVDAFKEAADELGFRDYRIYVFDERGQLLAANNAASGEPNLADARVAKLAADFSNAAPPTAFFTLSNDETSFRIIAQKNSGGRNFNVIVAHSFDEDEEILERFRNILLISVPLVLMLASFGGYFLARKTLSPIAQMSETAAAIGATNLHARLPVKNEKDELGVLATIFNSLLARLENSFERKKRFMADASHELRTPLAIVRGESEIALSKEQRPNAELRESLGIVNDESKRLTRIVEDIFTLARVDAGQFQAQFAEIYLDELLTDCRRNVRVLA